MVSVSIQNGFVSTIWTSASSCKRGERYKKMINVYWFTECLVLQEEGFFWFQGTNSTFRSVSKTLRFFWIDVIADTIINHSSLIYLLFFSVFWDALTIFQYQVMLRHFEIKYLERTIFISCEQDKSCKHMRTQIILLIIKCYVSTSNMIIYIFLWLYSLLFHLSDIAVKLCVSVYISDKSDAWTCLWTSVTWLLGVWVST